MSEPPTELELLDRAESGAPNEETLADNPILAPVVSFVRGAYSFPHDWWLGIHWVLGMQGVYGPRMQASCQRISRQLDTMMDLAVRGFPLSYRLTSVVVKYLLRDELTRCASLDATLQRFDRMRILGGAVNLASAFAGRYAGGVFTLYASTGGRFGRNARTGAVRYGYIFSNLLLASTGSLVKLAIETRGVGVTVADMAIVMLTGRAGAAFTSDEWVAIYRGVEECALTIDLSDQEAYRLLNQALVEYHDEVRRSVQ